MGDDDAVPVIDEQQVLFEMDPTPIIEDGVEYRMVLIKAHYRKVRVRKEHG